MTHLHDVAELEQLAILAEHDSGLTPEGMTRPLHPWEESTDWAAIGGILAAAYESLEGIIQSVKDAVIASLSKALDGAPDPMAALVAWTQTQDPVVRRAIQRAITRISAVLAGVYAAGSAILANDARKQGVAGDAEQEGQPSRFVPLALGAALWATLRIPQSVIQSGPAPKTAEQLLNLAKAVPIDGGVDLARQAAHIAHGQGRLDTVQALPTPTEMYASELLDGRSCGPCSDIDGQRYDTLAAALSDYPGMGPFKNCSGGARCRGTLVIVHDSEAPPSVPAHPTPQPTPQPPSGFDPEPFRRATTHREVSNLLGAVVNGNVSGFDDTALDLAAVKKTAEHVAGLFHLAPFVDADVAVLPLSPAMLRTGVLAYARAQKRGKAMVAKQLVLSRSELMPGANLGDKFQKAVNSGHFHKVPAGTDGLRYITAHEFGHLLDYMTSAKGGIRAQNIRDALLRKAGLTRGAPDAIQWVDEQISGYGQSKIVEMVAEAFADVQINADSATAVSKAITEVLLREAKP